MPEHEQQPEHILQAALDLYRLRRFSSSQLFVEKLVRNPDGLEPINRFLRAMTIREVPFAIRCLDSLNGCSSPIDEFALVSLWQLLTDSAADMPINVEFLHARLRFISSAHGQKQKIATQEAGSGVCYVLAQSLPHDTTGYSVRSHYLAQAITQTGIDITCLTRPGFPWNRDITDVEMCERLGAVKYLRSGSKEHKYPKKIADFVSAEKELIRVFRSLNPALVMAASNHATAIPALCAARHLNLPFVYEVRGFWELSRVARDPAWRNTAAFRDAYALESFMAAQSDLVFTLTRTMADELERRGTDAERIRLAKNAADPEEFAPKPRLASLAARLGIPSDVPVIGYIGSFNAYEGLDDLIEAAGGLAGRGYDFRLLLVGGEPNKTVPLVDIIREKAAAAGIANRVILPGRVDAKEVSDWYSLIDIAPLPRKATEVTKLVPPLKLWEAMAMQKAIVVPDLPPFLESVKHGKTGLVYTRGNVAALEDELEKLMVNEKFRRTLGEEARRWVVEDRTWLSTAEGIHHALREFFPAIRLKAQI